VAAAGRVALWRTNATIARDMGKKYTGPRTIPAFVAMELRQAGRSNELAFMQDQLGFLIEEKH
jgi:hypothetical protein